TANGATRLRVRGVTQTLTDHHADLPFVLHVLRRGGKLDGLVLCDKRGGRLEEQQRRCGHIVAHFGGMRTVVATDADDLGGSEHWKGERWTEPEGRRTSQENLFQQASSAHEVTALTPREKLTHLRVPLRPRAYHS